MRAHDAGEDAAATPVRVLWLTKGLGVGGLERILCWWASYHDTAAVDPHVAYVLERHDALVADLRRLGTPVTSLRGRRDLDLRWVLRLRRLLVDGRFDIVHSHSPYVAACARIAVRTLPRGRRPKLVCTDHNVWRDFRVPARVVHALTSWLDDAHFAVSEAVRRSVAKPLRSRVEVLVPGIPVDDVRRHLADRDRVRSELHVRPEDVVVITLANLRAAKRYDDLVLAASRVLEDRAGTKFVAIGEGPMQWPILSLVAELGITDRFRLLGLREDAAPLLAGADVFVLTSDHEGGPLAVLEAMAAGLPVVATRVGLVPDAVEDGTSGRIVDVGDVEGLAEAILDLADRTDERRRMGAAAAARVEQFDVRHALRALEKRYLELARG